MLNGQLQPAAADDLGTPYDGPRPATRVVSLVPSITEALASVRPRRGRRGDRLVHAPGRPRRHARGTGARHQEPRPGRDPGAAARRGGGQQGGEPRARRPPAPRVRRSGSGSPTSRRCPQAVDRLERLLDGARLGPPGLAGAGAGRVVRRRSRRSPGRWRSPVWRDPWMVVGRDTFTGDLVRRLGWDNVYADERGPLPQGRRSADLDAAGADVVLLPDEPYVFTAGRRSGGVHPDADRAGQRSPADLVRALAARGPPLATVQPSCRSTGWMDVVTASAAPPRRPA